MRKKQVLTVSRVRALAIQADIANPYYLVHGANGYLISQFLDSSSNQRTDKWGGSVANRSRFGLEVLKEVCDVWGPEQVAIKLNPCGGYNDVG